MSSSAHILHVLTAVPVYTYLRYLITEKQDIWHDTRDQRNGYWDYPYHRYQDSTFLCLREAVDGYGGRLTNIVIRNITFHSKHLEFNVGFTAYNVSFASCSTNRKEVVNLGEGRNTDISIDQLVHRSTSLKENRSKLYIYQLTVNPNTLIFFTKDTNKFLNISTFFIKTSHLTVLYLFLI